MKHAFPSRVPSHARILAVAFTVLAASSCGGDGSTSPAPAVPQSIALSPSTASVYVGATQAFTVVVRDGEGNAMTGQTVVWSVSDSSTLSVSAGTVTGLKAGSANVTASIGAVKGSASLTVAVVPVSSVVVSATTLSPVVRSLVQFSAITKDASGGVLTGRAVTWSSSDTTVARVDASGAVIAVRAGHAQISGTSEGKTGSLDLTVSAGTLQYHGLYTQFERRGFANGYYSGDAIKEFQVTDPFVPSLGLVKTEIAAQMDSIKALGVNTITFELRSADATLQTRAYPNCNVSPSTGLLYPQPATADLDNLVAFFDLANQKGLKVFLRLVNAHMDESARTNSQTWLGSILTRVASHPALELVLFEGDTYFTDSNGDGTVDTCGGLAEPPLYLGPDMPAAKYVQWAIGYAQSLGIPANKLSAQAVLGSFVVDMELGAGANAQDRHQWHALGVMKTIFDRLSIPEDQRTYAVSFYQSRKCAFASGYTCTDADPAAWANETLLRAWSKVGWRSRSRIVAVEWGVVTPFPTGWNSDQAVPVGAAAMRNYGLSGGSFWRWTSFDNAEDADPGVAYGIKFRGTNYSYSPAATALRQAYSQP